MAENSVADIGLIGLAVMGENLALNIADHGFKCAVYNRTTETMKKFVEREKHSNIVGCESVKDLIAATSCFIVSHGTRFGCFSRSTNFFIVSVVRL